MMPEAQEPKEKKTAKLVGFALNSRKKNPGFRRNIEKGLNPRTEQYAYSAIIPLSEGANQETRFVRIAGLIASSDIPQNSKVTFGKWLANITNQSSGVEKKLLRFIYLDSNQIYQEVMRVISYATSKNNKTSEGFDWYRLAETLYYWGDGVSENSVKTRQSILKDFYRIDHNPTSVDKMEENND